MSTRYKHTSLRGGTVLDTSSVQSTAAVFCTSANWDTSDCIVTEWRQTGGVLSQQVWHLNPMTISMFSGWIPIASAWNHSACIQKEKAVKKKVIYKELSKVCSRVMMSQNKGQKSLQSYNILIRNIVQNTKKLTELCTKWRLITSTGLTSNII